MVHLVHVHPLSDLSIAGLTTSFDSHVTEQGRWRDGNKPTKNDTGPAALPRVTCEPIVLPQNSSFYGKYTFNVYDLG